MYSKHSTIVCALEYYQHYLPVVILGAPVVQAIPIHIDIYAIYTYI